MTTDLTVRCWSRLCCVVVTTAAVPFGADADITCMSKRPYVMRVQDGLRGTSFWRCLKGTLQNRRIGCNKGGRVMREAERFLKDYWYATRSIGRLMLDLSAARQAYEQSLTSLSVSGGFVKAAGRQRTGHSAVERAAVIAVDQFHAEVMSIEKRLLHERSILSRIEQMVRDAGLTAPEAGYVRLRYFEGRSVEAAAQRLYCSAATCGRLRVSALSKIECAIIDKKPTPDTCACSG